jgi:tetratricopeptide (TPR) repeat protein
MIAQQALPRRPEPDDTLGWIYYRQGLATRAIEAFARAVTQAPDKAVYHYHLGLAQLKAGLADQGRSALRRALALGLSGADREAADAALAANDAATDARVAGPR